jgi:hypothetical protein
VGGLVRFAASVRAASICRRYHARKANKRRNGAEERRMKRLFAIVAVLALAAGAVSATGASTDAEVFRDRAWSIKADYTDTCSCAATCPCFFGSAPTRGHCEGITLVEIERGHYGDVQLDGVKVLAVYRGGTWMKFYVSQADEAQTEAAVLLLPTFEQFFVSDNVLEVENVPITVERNEGWVKISAPNTTAEIEVMRGKNGEPIKIENLPAPAYPAPPFQDHTQYRSVILKHETENEQFEYSGTTGFTAKISAVAEPGAEIADTRGVAGAPEDAGHSAGRHAH